MGIFVGEILHERLAEPEGAPIFEVARDRARPRRCACPSTDKQALPVMMMVSEPFAFP
jgi:hypothetical protein